MRKVFKPENIFKSENTVMIPDIEFEPEVTEEEVESAAAAAAAAEEEKKILKEEIYQEVRAQMQDELAGELGRKKLSAAHDRDVLMNKAKKEAQRLVDDANVSRRQILDEASSAAETIKKNAYDEGLKKGIADKSELLENLAHYISHSIEQLKKDEEEYFKEYEKQLKYVALEMAEKIIYQKIQDDDMTMYNLVKSAIKTVRSSAWIKAEVSEKLSSYADSLEKELADSGINVELIISETVPDDTCVLNTAEGVVIATVSEQIANLREYISRQDKGGNDEDLSRPD
ncbi:MAG: hypothetical protein IJN85_05130 [Oscillospiraceae bacterium]|nr:hypothetical protein [Oscillospiraceae bacterium]